MMLCSRAFIRYPPNSNRHPQIVIVLLQFLLIKVPDIIAAVSDQILLPILQAIRIHFRFKLFIVGVIFFIGTIRHQLIKTIRLAIPVISPSLFSLNSQASGATVSDSAISSLNVLLIFALAQRKRQLSCSDGAAVFPPINSPSGFFRNLARLGYTALNSV